MKQRPRIYYTESQRALMWERWQKGDSLQQIAQLFDRYHSSIERILAESGGIRPAQRRRSRLALTLAEREEISRAVAAGQSIYSIAASLGRAPSTIYREINRNGDQECYRGRKTQNAVVAGADCWLAETYLPERRELSGVTRNHLSQPLHSSSWGTEERTGATFEVHSINAPFAEITSNLVYAEPEASYFRRRVFVVQADCLAPVFHP